jgi:hypothetical protein
VGRYGWLVALTATLVAIGGCCAGAFMLVGGRNTSCVPGRPAGVGAEDLAGRYLTDDYGVLILDRSGTFVSHGIVIEFEFESEPLTLAGPGTWSLLARDQGFGDVSLSFSDARCLPGDLRNRTRPWLHCAAFSPRLTSRQPHNWPPDRSTVEPGSVRWGPEPVPIEGNCVAAEPWGPAQHPTLRSSSNAIAAAARAGEIRSRSAAAIRRSLR